MDYYLLLLLLLECRYCSLWNIVYIRREGAIHYLLQMLLDADSFILTRVVLCVFRQTQNAFPNSAIDEGSWLLTLQFRVARLAQNLNVKQ